MLLKIQRWLMMVMVAYNVFVILVESGPALMGLLLSLGTLYFIRAVEVSERKKSGRG